MFLPRLMSLCELRNTTISAAVKAAGGNTGSIDGWKKKGSMPRSELIACLADQLETTADYLLGRTDDPSPISHGMRALDADEIRLVDGLRHADPPVRSAIFRMVDAALAAPPAVRVEKPAAASFLSPNDDNLRHKRRTKKRSPKRVEGKAAAGLPITAVPEGDLMVSVPAKYLSDSYFIVQAQGDSMIDAGIDDGDFCIFKIDGYYDDGQIMLVQVDGSTDEPDVTIKRVFRHDGEVELRSENSAYPPMFYPASDTQFVGVLVDIVSIDA